ncbi:MAG TPA: PLP-dependent aminotransferase family protein [Chryseolinea sp.]
MITITTPFSDRIKNIPESFIREILKVSSKPEMISFAGGLPNPNFFPVEKIARAAEKVLTRDGAAALQYWITEGYMPLRDYIAHWQSKKTGRQIVPEEIIMLNGSQQGLDLVGKVFINKGRNVLLEGPSYLGAIQAFSLYEPSFHHIKIDEGGPDTSQFNATMKKLKPAIFYCVPNFQNPTGNTYDLHHREAMSACSESAETVWIEDNPYAEIFFEENNLPDLCAMMPEKTISLGSFSKIISPGMRMGWALGPKEFLKKLGIAKQASDLHSNNLSQRIIYQFLLDNPLEDHLDSIRTFYRQQAELMMTCMKQYFPGQVTWTIPKGGMFIWVTLPETLNAHKLLERAILQNVLFVPGQNFYVGSGLGANTLRMNFSNPSNGEIVKGIMIMGELIREMMCIDG